ncbi:phage minor head protein [Corynebacterium sp.]|uniref:phage minor head protein n=1 Tax=Corynebacterium sp. TaxID=1720 RepID=UPI0026DAB2D3|nr:phage minor head protein [Corynebacterium sp.]MDO4610977.1 phage minor head protein [Corynebacterium sp.]
MTPDLFDEWAPRAEDAVLRAAREWFASVPVFPSLTAAADGSGDDADGDGGVFDLGAILIAASTWPGIAGRALTPVLIAAAVDQAAAVFRSRGVSPEALAGGDGDTAGLLAVFAEEIRAAETIISATGAAADYVTVTLHSPVWADFITRIAESTPTLVSGMPDGLYRDLVTHLAAMSRDGAGAFERARWARQFLSFTDEGGYEQWMRRARRIARTETQRMIQAATMHAARVTQDTTGEPLEKAWVATLDPRTRDTHFAADGQRVPLDAKFTLGGHECDHPGDPALPAHECINCRCSVVLLAPDDPLPGDTDRQTERERADGTIRDPQAEVARRAADGVTRTRDDDTTVTASGQETRMRTQWAGMLAPIGKPTGDDRIIDPDATITFRTTPLPLLWQKATSGGHDNAVIVGKITEATADAKGIHAAGEFLDTPEARAALDLAREGVIRPSVDMCDMVTDWEFTDTSGTPVDPETPTDWNSVREVMHVRSATIMAATLVATPAFAEAAITVGDEQPAPEEDDTQALVAAAAALTDAATAPAAAFADPGLTAPTALTVTDDGRVYGHLALWGTEHVGMPGRRVTPPHSASDYAFFHVSTITTDGGPVAVGRLTVGCGHAGAADTAAGATAHYDDAGTCWALVRAGEDDHGIWVAGIVNPDAAPETVRAGASAPLSGDWRSIGGTLELVAALSVNTPGFPVPRAGQASMDERVSLVAAGVVPRSTAHERMVAAVLDALDQRDRARRDAAAAEARAAEARGMAARMMQAGLAR